MRKLTAGLFHSLDGVVEAPNLWQFDAFDDELGASLGASIAATDTVLLGSLGPDSLAAGGLGANFFFVIVTVLQGVLSSVSVSVAHARGAQAEDRVPHIYWTGFVLSVLLAIPAIIALSLSEPILLMFHEPPTITTTSIRPCMPCTWKSRMTASRMFRARITAGNISAYLFAAALRLNRSTMKPRQPASAE